MNFEACRCGGPFHHLIISVVPLGLADAAQIIVEHVPNHLERCARLYTLCATVSVHSNKITAHPAGTRTVFSHACIYPSMRCPNFQSQPRVYMPVCEVTYLGVRKPPRGAFHMFVVTERKRAGM